MNELRMYVEHLFEGKVLTGDMIELKEEIYGNLVARYEDYVAGGMGEAEALERTKASITSVDDVISDEADGASKADAAQTTVLPGEPAPAAGASAEAESAGATSKMHLPTPPGAVGSDAAPTASGAAPRKRLSGGAIAAIVVVAVAVVVFLGVVLFEGVVEPVLDYREDVVESQLDASSDAPGITLDDGRGNSVDLSGDGLSINDDQGNSVDLSSDGSVHVQSGNDAIYLDDAGNLRIEGDLADDILTAVVNHPYSAVAAYVGTPLSDASAVDAFVRSLPMGQWASSIDVTKGNGMLAYEFANVPDTYDGDSIEAALAYDATAILCAMPDVQRVQIRVSESDDPYDFDCYVFQRSVAEQLYGVALTGDMVSEAGWSQIKTDNLYKHDFIDHMVELAERDGR